MRAADLAVAAAALWWALPLTSAIGGRNVRDETVLVVLLALATALVRPWRTLPAATVVIPCCVSFAALVVPVFAPTGWRGADDAVSYVCASMAFVVAAGWADSRSRRLILAGAVSLAALHQVLGALLHWWSQQNPDVIVYGTFYSHNPFAAYLLPATVLGVGLVGWRVRPLHIIGWLLTPFCVAGIVLSTSRATLGVLVVAWCGWLLLALRRRDRVGSLLRSGVLATVSIGLTYALTGPPFFAARTSPLQATAQRSARGETLAANGEYRVEFWKSALTTLRHHPLIGTGYHGLVEASSPLTPASWGRSNYAHNGYLQALSDGGLLLGLPVIIASGVLVWLAVRTLVNALRHGTVDRLTATAGVMVLATLAHSAIDLDWSHSALFVMDALVAALLISGQVRRENPPSQPRISAASPWLAGALAAVLALAVALGALGTRDAQAGITSGLPDPARAAQLSEQAGRPLASSLPARLLLQLALKDPAAVSSQQRETAIRVTRREASIDLDLATSRAQVALTLGDRAPAQALLGRLLSVAANRPAYAADLGILLSGLGQQQGAQGVLRAAALEALHDHDAIDLPALVAAFLKVQGPQSASAACLQRERQAAGTCTPQEVAAA